MIPMFASIAAGAVGLLFMLLIGAIGLACTIFWLWMLIHAITNKGLPDGEKIVWVLVIVFLPFLGSILYFFIGKPKG
jgi:Phospholipase_D-nuclease N-terminal